MIVSMLHCTGDEASSTIDNKRESMDSKFNWIGNAIDFLSQSVFRLIAHARAVWLIDIAS